MKKINVAFFMVAMLTLVLCISAVSAQEDAQQNDNILTSQLSEDNVIATVKPIDNNKLMDKKSNEALVNCPELDRQKEDHSEIDDSTEKVNERRNNDEQFDKDSIRHIKSSDESSNPNLIRTSSPDQIGVDEENINVELIIDDYYLVYTNDTVNGLVMIDGVETGNVPVKVYINNTEYNTTTDDDGQFTVNFVPTAKADNIEVYAKVKDTTSKTETTDFVGELKLDLTTSDNPTVYSDYNITGKVYVEYDSTSKTVADGTYVNLTINATCHMIQTNAEGIFNYTYTPQNKGEIEINITVYKELLTTYTINASGINTKILVYQGDYSPSVIDGQPFTFNGTLVDVNEKPIKNARVTIKIQTSNNDDRLETEVWTNNEGYFVAEPFTANKDRDEEYYAYAKYNGDNIYNEVEIINHESDSNYVSLAIVESEGYEVKIDEIQDTFRYGETVTINGTVMKDGNWVHDNDVCIIVNGEVVKTEKTDDEGQFTYNYVPESIKKYYVKATCNGYSSNNYTFNVVKGKTMIVIDDIEPVVIGNNVVITGYVINNNTKQRLVNKDLTIKIYSDNIKTKTDINGNFSSEAITTKIAGTNNVVVELDSSDYLEGANEEKSFEVEKHNTTVTVNASDAKAGQNTTINGTVTDENNNPIADAPVKVEIADNTYETSTNNNGYYKVQAILQAGKNTITVKINETDTAKSATKNITIDVKKQESATTAVLKNNTAGNVTLTVNVTDKTTKQPITMGNIEVINSATNNVVANAVITGAKTTVITSLNESGSYNLTVKFMETEIYNTSQCNLNNVNIQKRAVTLTVTTINNTINNTAVNITVSDKTSGKKIANAQVSIILPNKTTINTTTDSKGMLIQSLTLPAGKNKINVTYIGSKTYSNTSKSHTIDVKKITTKTTINAVTAYLGDEITLKAKVTASNAIAVNNGNVIFKLNGVTIKDNCKLSGSDNPLKIKVVNGVATATITADSSMRNANQITAHYIENTDYTASNSTAAKVTLNVRTATITVTTNTKKIKQGQNLTITAKIYDTTGAKKTNKLVSSGDDFVYFKINGVTLKDAKGEMLKVKVVNGVATINYTIPLGLSCVTDTQTMTPKNHTILAVYYNKNYADDIKNTTTFQVERSNITINLANATINNKTHSLSMKITIKDYLGNVVSGPNKLVIKVNGVTLKNGTQVQYFYTTDGILNLKNIPVPASKNYTTIEVITQDRVAYNSQRNTTTKIRITN